jgi:hypothetical protein
MSHSRCVNLALDAVLQVKGGALGLGGCVADSKKIGMVMLKMCRCRCGHEWLPRAGEPPRVCPKSKSPKQERS